LIWFTNDIDAYLSDYHITHAIVALTGHPDSASAILKQQLDNHQIIILCLDMNHLRSVNPAGVPVAHSGTTIF
jgi:hypothetical protein